MCGIIAALGIDKEVLGLHSKSPSEKSRTLVRRMSKMIRHRGPDWSAIEEVSEGNFLAHERLAIMSPDLGKPNSEVYETGDQPLRSRDGRYKWVVNGEIYNAKELKEEHNLDPLSSSDSEVVGLLYARYGSEFVHMLDGMFALVVYDVQKGEVFAARDHMGICSMYIAQGANNSVWMASEMKCFAHRPNLIKTCDIFPAGFQYTSAHGLQRWYNPHWISDLERHLPEKRSEPSDLRSSLVRAVEKRMRADVPFGVLLSGGLDSSLIASIASKCKKGGPGNLKTFSIGIKNAPDLVEARKVAESLGTDHHEFHFTPREALDAVEDVVYHLESTEQVRAAVPMFLLARKIQSLGVKMVLSGEGADEVFGGYLYFHKAPSQAEFHRECARKTSRLHQWDVMRANKAPLAWGVEVRVPFLDKDLLALAMETDPGLKTINMQEKPDGVHPKMEKYFLRKAFDVKVDGAAYLPETVLWRQKEQLSDGVGYDWVDSLRRHAEGAVGDAIFCRRSEVFGVSTPESKEYFFLRQIFNEAFPEEWAIHTVPHEKSIACSSPEAALWDPAWEGLVGDISGRAMKDVHVAANGYAPHEKVFA